MGCLPYYAMYPSDFEIDTGSMTAEQVGAFVRMLNHSWAKGGCPTDFNQLARIVRVTKARFTNALWPALSDLWIEKNGALVNKRQEKERAEAFSRHRKRVEAGKKGGLVKPSEAKQ